MEEVVVMKKCSIFFKNYFVYLCISFVVLVLPILLYFVWNFFDVLKKDVVIELGNGVTEQDFFKKEYNGDVHFLTPLSSFDIQKVGEYDVTIEINHKKRVSTLKIVDTVAPEVETQDVYAYLDYSFDPNDFIVSKNDLSSMEVSFLNVPEITELGDYPLTILVRDAYGNTTSQDVVLHVGLVKTYYELELGTQLKKEDLLYQKDQNIEVDPQELQNINTGGVGDYHITVHLNDMEIITKVKVQDTTPPVLNLKNVTIYDDVSSVKTEDFIDSIVDSSSVTTRLDGNISYGVVGSYEVTITAVDASGLQTSGGALLTIVHDTVAPVIYGLSNLTVNKNTVINYLSGVYAKDDKDGNVSVSVNSRSVNVSRAGTYYASYTAKDKAGNVKTASRKIIVNHDASDTAALAKEYANKVSSSIPEINQFVKKLIGYSDSWGGDDPVWYGLTNFRGNCYVHALVYKAILEAKGYTVQIIHTTDRSHYWNLVYTGTKWCHSDATPGNLQEGIICSNDTERINMLQGRDWDHSLWPAAQ